MPNFVKHYAIFWQTPLGNFVWCRATNKRAALRHARVTRGVAMSVPYGSDMAWDAPTFKVSGDMVRDFRHSTTGVVSA